MGESSGGAIYTNGGNTRLTLSHCTFEGNTASFYGGGLYLDTLTLLEMSECTFEQNVAYGKGGAVFLDRSPLTLTNCTFVDNTAPIGSAIVVRHTYRSAIDNCIVVWNNDGEPVSCLDGGSADMWCCDVYGNVAGDWVGCLSGQLGQDGNICEDPLFCGEFNPAQPFSLNENSPCLPGNSQGCSLIGAWPIGCPYSDVREDGFNIPQALQVTSLEPNPFMVAAMIEYRVDQSHSPSAPCLRIFDTSGRSVRTLAQGFQPGGEYLVTWRGDDDFGRQVPSGVYIVRLEGSGKTVSRHLVRLR